MDCPSCNGRMIIAEERLYDEYVKRHWRCQKCGHKLTTEGRRRDKTQKPLMERARKFYI